MNDFLNESKQRVAEYQNDARMLEMAHEFTVASVKAKYSYNFFSLGIPIIQYPQDIVAMQELIWNVKPDLIIETGVAHGGSLVQSAAMLALLDLTDAISSGLSFDPSVSKRKVLGIDVDIRRHNREAIESHPMSSRIEMIEGSSISDEVIKRVGEYAKDFSNVLVCLDSNHTHDHVLAELHAYAPMVSPGNYCVVFDTLIEDMPDDSYPDRPWGRGNNPKTAVWEFLAGGPDFEIDRGIHEKLLITVASDGFLKRVS